MKKIYMKKKTIMEHWLKLAQPLNPEFKDFTCQKSYGNLALGIQSDFSGCNTVNDACLFFFTQYVRHIFLSCQSFRVCRLFMEMKSVSLCSRFPLYYRAPESAADWNVQDTDGAYEWLITGDVAHNQPV